MIASKGGASEPLNIGLPGKAGGAAAVRRTLASTICRIADPTLVARPRQLRDVSTVMRFRPAHQSMINRRHDGRASCLAWYSPNKCLKESHEFTRLLLGKADMRVVRTKQMTPVAPSSVTPAKAGVQSPTHVSAALDARFRGHDEEEQGC